ncbi:MAG: type IV pilus twitching motility protein PilT, partial [Gemmatimonadales bacterium]
LVLVTGVTGSGKSSTVAGMINHINQNLHRHIVTIENPIEFLHRDVNCSVTQREVGVDTESFAIGLQAALRQDPDVVVIGEMRDTETLDTAIKAAEMGNLVISSMPTPDVTSTISRLLAMFPAEERDIGRLRLSEAIRAVIAQRLLPRADGKGRVAAVEIMVSTPQTRSCIQVPDRLDDLTDKMAKGREAHGMQTFEQHFEELVTQDEISSETAKAAAGENEPSPRKSRR